MARLSADGVADTGFGDAGIAVVDFGRASGSASGAYGVAIDPDGRTSSPARSAPTTTLSRWPSPDLWP